jgi:hypothetical protein
MVGKKINFKKMRKLVLIIAAFAFISIGSSAKGKTKVKEVQMFAKNTQLIHVGLGINGTAMPIELSYEKGIKDDLFGVKGLNLGVGGYFNYFGSSSDFAGFNEVGPVTYTWKYTNIVLGGRALAHYKLIPQLDTYAGVMVGYDIFGSKLSPENSMIPATGTSFIFYGGVAGIRYEFSPKLGIYLEGGSASVSNASIGIAYKF